MGIFTVDDGHCICVRNIQVNILYLFHFRLKDFIPILNCYIFIIKHINWNLSNVFKIKSGGLPP